jgi:DNA-binding NtrC family response regulator
MFLARCNAELGRLVPLTLADETLRLLENYPWPGNVRELRNVIERGAVLCSGDVLRAEHLPQRVLTGGVSRASTPPSSLDGAREDALARARHELQGIERHRILEALEQCGGNQTRAAEALGISRRTLVYRLGDLGLPRPRKR